MRNQILLFAVFIMMFLDPSCATAMQDQIKPIKTISGWNCYRNEYASIVLKENEGAIGSTFMIRKTTVNIDDDCSISRRNSDVSIGDKDPNYYIRLVKSFLIIDSGTSNVRTITFYDVPSGNRIISSEYFDLRFCDISDGCENNDFRIKKNGVIFWRKTSDKPNKYNCRNLNILANGGYNVAIMNKTFFDFNTRKLKDFKIKRCEQRE